MGRQGFTVAEVFMVITLLVLVAGLMVVPVQRIVEALNARPLEAVLLSTVREAHILAMRLNESVCLSYLSETNRLQFHTRNGAWLGDVEVYPPSDDGSPTLRFYRLRPEDPRRVKVAYEAEADPVDSIPFHPSGASTPFAVEIEQRNTRVRLVLDPFSSAPLSREEGS